MQAYDSDVRIHGHQTAGVNPHALSEAVPRAGAAPGEGARLRFGVRLGPYHLLIALQTFSEVVARPVIAPLPHTPPWFLGLLNQRGNLLPVFDLLQALHAGEPKGAQRTVLVLDQASDAVGLCIDGMPQAVTLAQRAHELPSLPDLLAAHVTTAYRVNTTVWLDFDHRGCFTALGAQITQASGVTMGRV